MPLTSAWYQSTLELFGAVRPLEFRKMFGGAGLYGEGVFFAIFDDDRIFFKVDAETLPEYDAFGAKPWVLEGKDSPNYRELPAEVLRDPERLGVWIDASVAAARRLKRKK